MVAPSSMYWGECEECSKNDNIVPGEDLKLYCADCWEYYELQNTRCFSFAVIYEANSGKQISFGSSNIGHGCAERMALWKMNVGDQSDKVLCVARIIKKEEPNEFW